MGWAALHAMRGMRRTPRPGVLSGTKPLFFCVLCDLFEDLRLR